MGSTILTVTLKYIENIKNGITLSSLAILKFVLIINLHLSEMEIKMYRILHVKAFEFLCQKFSHSSLCVVVFLALNLDSGYLDLSFSCVFDKTDGDCGCSFVPDRRSFYRKIL